MPTPQGTETSINQSKATESAAWQTVGHRAGSSCGASTAPPARERAVEQSDCVTALIRQHVLPVAAFPDLLMTSRADARRLAVSYADGKLTPLQYQTMSKNRMDAYRKQWLVQAAGKTLWDDAVKPVVRPASLPSKPEPAVKKPEVARL
ncbi:MAG: hypothetical protein ACAH80_15000 [Alphaproteobacteria bacterium]